MLKPATQLLFRQLLRLRKARGWHDLVTAPDNLLGTPANEEKIWNSFKQNIKPYLRFLATVQWIKIRSVSTHIRVQTIKPVKPTKKFIIMLTNLPQSVQSAERCIKSAKKYGEDYNLEIMPAIDKFESHDFFVRHNLTWDTQQSSFDSPSAMGCFASHFMLWLRCMELGEPIIVLEHDAVFHAAVPELKFKHVVMLGKSWKFTHWTDKINEHQKRETFYPWKYLMGTHAYAITPEGARRLVEIARQELLPPVDVFMCKKFIDILHYLPCPIHANPRFSSVTEKVHYYPNRNRGEEKTFPLDPPPDTLNFAAQILLRRFLRVRTVQQWRKNLIMPGNLLGEPLNDIKQWRALKRRIKPYLYHTLAMQWMRIVTVGTHIRMWKVKPVKPARKFIITLTNLPQSVQATEYCIESAKRYGEDRNLEIMPAIDKFEAHDFFVRHGLTWKVGLPSLNPLPEMGCFASHFTLWLRCMEMGKPIIVLEHDAMFRASIPALTFRHVIVLGKRYQALGKFGKNDEDTHKRLESCHPWPHLMGTHSYAITPEGARRLVEATRRDLLPPTDVFMSKRHIDILYCHPSPVILNSNFSSVALNSVDGGPGAEETWKDYTPAQP